MSELGMPTLNVAMNVTVSRIDNGWLVKITSGGPTSADPLGMKAMRTLQYCANLADVHGFVGEALELMEEEKTGGNLQE